MTEVDARAARFDPITLEMIAEGTISIVREMRQTVFRTAHSPVISEAQDFSCALFNARGEMVAQSRDMPGHVIAMPASVAEAMEAFGAGLQPGDVIILNDPYRGGSHLNDVTLVYPVFVEGALFMLPCVRMHWADIGGMTPGSIYGMASEIFQEGVRIPPIKLIEGGRENVAATTLLFANVRGAEQRRGDFDACLAACRTAERRLRDLAARYGLPEIGRYLQIEIGRAEARLRQRIAALPDGTYCYEDSLDLFTDGLYDPVLVRCALTVHGDGITADFTGSSPQVGAVVNGSKAMSNAGVFIILKSVLDPGGRINAGAFRPVQIVAPAGTVVHVVYPAPANAHSEVRKRVLSAVSGALAQVAPEAVTADQCGTTFQNLLGGFDANGASYLYYDFPPGGNGGFPEGDGPDVMNPVDLGDISTVQPVEMLEATCPVLVESCLYRTDSCGDGTRRGGLGARRQTRLLAEQGTYSVQADRAVVPPWGLQLGHAAAPIRTARLSGSAVIEFPTPGKVGGQVFRRGDVLVMESAGGGGWGDPLERTPDSVRYDLANELISPARALSIYGVVLNPDGTVDDAATRQRRQALAGERTYFTLGALPDSLGFTGRRGTHRRVEVSAETAARHSLPIGSLIELHGRHPAPLRAWVYLGEQPPDTAALSADGLAILGLQAGGRVLMRTIPTDSRVA